MKPFDDRSPEESVDGVDAREIDEHAHQRGDDNDAVELFCPAWILIQSQPPPERLRQGVRCRASQDRHGEKAGAGQS